MSMMLIAFLIWAILVCSIIGFVNVATGGKDGDRND